MSASTVNCWLCNGHFPVRQYDRAALDKRASEHSQQHQLGTPVTRHDVIKMADWEGDRKCKRKCEVGWCSSHVHVPAVRQELQTIVDVVHTSTHPHGLSTVSVPVLRKTFPPEVGHEETHLHPHRSVLPPANPCTLQRISTISK